MKNRLYSRTGAQLMLRCFLTAAVVGLVTVLWGTAAGAQEAKSDAKGEPIRITADRLVTDNEKKTAQFSGNVKAVQGKTTITSQRLKIFYRSKSGHSSGDSQNSIQRLEANGNVRIEFDNKVAVSNQAVYIIAERKLVLTGPGSKVISGKDEISGSRITFYREDGRVLLEGDDDNRVNAIIHSGQRGLN